MFSVCPWNVRRGSFVFCILVVFLGDRILNYYNLQKSSAMFRIYLDERREYLFVPLLPLFAGRVV